MKPYTLTEPIRFAVIGCGSVARAQHIPKIASSPRRTLPTCVDLSDAILAEFGLTDAEITALRDAGPV